MKLNKVVKRVRENYDALLEYTDAVRDEILRRCHNLESGARLIDAVVNNELLPEISGAFLRQLMEGKTFTAAQIDADPEGNRFIYRFATKRFGIDQGGVIGGIIS